MTIEYLANTLINDFKRKSEMLLDEIDPIDEEQDLPLSAVVALKMIRQSGFFEDRLKRGSNETVRSF